MTQHEGKRKADKEKISAVYQKGNKSFSAGAQSEVHTNGIGTEGHYGGTDSYQGGGKIPNGIAGVV